MDIFALFKRLTKRPDIGHMCRQTQLDLAIIGRQDYIAFLGDKSIADLTPYFGADRDIL